MDRPPKIYFEKIIFGKKSKKLDIFLTIYQLKNTSDCIKIDSPGPGQNLEKVAKSEKNDPTFWIILFRTWGMNLAIIACLFELVDGL